MNSNHQVQFTYLSQENLLDAGCFDLPMAIATAERAMIDYEQGKVLFPEKIVQIFNPATQERINCLPATLLDEKVCGMKWVSVFPMNPTRYQQQNLSAIFVLSEIETGFPIAVLEGTLASNMRVAAMGAIAAKHLARKDAESIGFIGAGEQAKMHLLAMKSVRPGIKRCGVCAKTAQEEAVFIRELSPLCPDIEFSATTTNARQAIEGADIVVTATSAQAPLLKAQWIKQGAFYSHVGGWEDEFDVALKADKIVCDDWDTVTHRTQTLSRMYKEGKLNANNIHADLHELVSGHKIGRETDDEFIYFNAVGLAYIDVAIAMSMFTRAKDKGVQLDLQQSMVFEHPGIENKVHL